MTTKNMNMDGISMYKNAMTEETKAMSVRRALESGDCTIGEIADITGLDLASVRSVINSDLGRKLVRETGSVGKYKIYGIVKDTYVIYRTHVFTPDSHKKKAAKIESVEKVVKHRTPHHVIKAKVEETLKGRIMSAPEIGRAINSDAKSIRLCIEQLQAQEKAVKVGQKVVRGKYANLYALVDGERFVSVKPEYLANYMGLKAHA